MWKDYLALDGWIISSLQDFYLWLLDRTGVYVATLMFITYIAGVSPDIIRGHLPWWNLIFIGLVGAIITLPYRRQDRGDVKRYNAFAISLEGMVIRHGFNGLQIGVAVGSIAEGNYLNVAGSLMMLIYQYWWVVKIRERDKKPFLKPAERLAADGA